MTQHIISQSRGDSFVSSIKKLWSHYVSLAYGIEDKSVDEEVAMRHEYDFFKHLRPVMSKTAEGITVVKGLLGLK
jgi:hypothetical protein